jgi:hypothetical protein
MDRVLHLVPHNCPKHDSFMMSVLIPRPIGPALLLDKGLFNVGDWRIRLLRLASFGYFSIAFRGNGLRLMSIRF